MHWHLHPFRSSLERWVVRCLIRCAVVLVLLLAVVTIGYLATHFAPAPFQTLASVLTLVVTTCVAIACYWWFPFPKNQVPRIQVNEGRIDVFRGRGMRTLVCDEVEKIKMTKATATDMHTISAEVEIRTDSEVLRCEISIRDVYECGDYLHACCQHAVYWDIDGDEHLPANFDHIDRIWMTRQSENSIGGAVDLGTGLLLGLVVVLAACFRGNLIAWVNIQNNPKPALLLLAMFGVAIYLIVQGGTKLVRWQSRNQEMAKSVEENDYSGAIDLASKRYDH